MNIYGENLTRKHLFCIKAQHEVNRQHQSWRFCMHVKALRASQVQLLAMGFLELL